MFIFVLQPIRLQRKPQEETTTHGCIGGAEAAGLGKSPPLAPYPSGRLDFHTDWEQYSYRQKHCG